MRNISLRTRFLIWIMGTTALLSFIAVVSIYFILYRNLFLELKERGVSLAKGMAVESVDTILHGDVTDLKILLYIYKISNEHIQYIGLFNSQGQTLAHTFDKEFPEYLKKVNPIKRGQAYSTESVSTENGAVLDIVVPILEGDIGVAHVGISMQYVKRTVLDILKLIIGVVVVMLILGAAVAIIFVRMITKPILELTKATRAIGEGDLRHKIRVTSNDEIGNLAISFNKMVDNLNSSKSEIISTRKYTNNILSAMVTALYVVSPEGKIQTVNTAACALLGYKEEELIGRPAEKIIPDYLAIKKEGTVNNIEEICLSKDGKEIPVFFSSSIMRDFNGRISGTICIAQDITERRRSDEALRENLRVLNTLMSNLPGMAYHRRNDKDWTMEFMSVGCFNLTGYRYSELFLNSTISYGQLIHPDDLEPVWNEIQTAIQKRESYTMTYRIKTATGHDKWVWEQGRGIFSSNAELLALEGLIIDITERKQAEEALHTAYIQIKEAQSQLVQAEKMESFGRLAAGIAHEVKNPLAILIQGIDYLTKNLKSDNKEISLTLKYMKDAVTRGDVIIKGLLDFASVSKLDIVLEDLNSVIDKSLLLVEHECNKRRIKVIKDFGEIPRVKIDKNRIQQVFLNLILNAIHAMPHGGEVKLKTYIKNLKTNERAVIAEIEDTGTGIRGEILPKIFDPFFTTRRDTGGTGLGLSVVKNIIDLHDGRIEIKNKKDHGVIATLIFKI